MATPLATILALSSQPNGPYRPRTVNPTDVGTITQQSAQDAYQTYAAKLAQQNALYGGLAGIGGSGILAAGLNPTISSKLMGLFTPAAAPAASAATPVANTLGSTLTGPSSLGTASSFLSAPVAAPTTVAAADAAPAATSIFDTGAAAVPFATGSTVAGDLAATAAPVAADAGAAAGAAGGLDLASILPFLFPLA